MEPSTFNVGQQVRFTKDAKEGEYSEQRYQGTFLVCNSNNSTNLSLSFGVVGIDEKYLELCEFSVGQRVFFTDAAQEILHDARATFTVKAVVGTHKGYQMLELEGRASSVQASLLEPVT